MEKSLVQYARENIAYYGINEVDLQSLLMVLTTGCKVSLEIFGRLSSYGVKNLSRMSIEDLRKEGISQNTAIKIVAAFGLSKKLALSKGDELITIRSPEDVSTMMMEELRYLQKEHFICLFLNTKNQVMGKETLSIGTLNSAIVHPREVFQASIKRSSASIICIHNHPSGDPTPSPEDIELTKRLENSGCILGIEVLDHVIIGNDKYVSLKEQGLM